MYDLYEVPTQLSHETLFLLVCVCVRVLWVNHSLVTFRLGGERTVLLVGISHRLDADSNEHIGRLSVSRECSRLLFNQSIHTFLSFIFEKYSKYAGTIMCWLDRFWHWIWSQKIEKRSHSIASAICNGRQFIPTQCCAFSATLTTTKKTVSPNNRYVVCVIYDPFRYAGARCKCKSQH